MRGPEQSLASRKGFWEETHLLERTCLPDPHEAEQALHSLQHAHRPEEEWGEWGRTREKEREWKGWGEIGRRWSSGDGRRNKERGRVEGDGKDG